MDWKSCKTLVTGGASFIGSHLVDALVERGAAVRVADNLSSGELGNIRGHLEGKRVEFRQLDLSDPRAAAEAVRGIDFVFHLAAVHGGRGFIDRNQAACATNLALDSVVFAASRNAGVGKVVFASSACVYPLRLQNDTRRAIYLSEDMVGPPYDADGMYGWAKLMAEMTLRAHAAEAGMKSASCRYFTVYGERCNENHAIMAMIARAFVGQDPFAVWGDGEQIRNWTHVSDIVRGTILAAEIIDDGSAVNLGTREGTRVIDAAREVLKYSGHSARIELQRDMPVGPRNRVADISLARRLLGWEPQVKLTDGLHRTIDWYGRNRDREQIAKTLERRLTGRGGELVREEVRRAP